MCSTHCKIHLFQYEPSRLWGRRRCHFYRSSKWGSAACSLHTPDYTAFCNWLTNFVKWARSMSWISEKRNKEKKRGKNRIKLDFDQHHRQRQDIAGIVLNTLTAVKLNLYSSHWSHLVCHAAVGFYSVCKIFQKEDEDFAKSFAICNWFWHQTLKENCLDSTKFFTVNLTDAECVDLCCSSAPRVSHSGKSKP